MADPIRVLYVDDEPALLQIGKLFLEKAGPFSIATIGSAHGALDRLTKEQFDAIISDYQMPDMDGIQFLIEVRKRFGKIPFILFTGKGREEIVIQAINNGADFYLQNGGNPDAQFAELSHQILMIVSQRSAEKAFTESEHRYRSLVENMHECVAVYRAVAEGDDFVILEFNHAAEKTEKVAREEVIGHRVTEVFPGVQEFGLLDVFRRVWRTGTSESFPVSFYKDNRISGWRDNFIFKLPSGEIVASYSDETARKQAEEALQHLTEFQESIITNAQVWMSVLDSRGKILAWNPAAAEISGYSSEEVIGKNEIWKKLYPEKGYRTQVTTTINRIIRDKKHLENFETFILTREGDVKAISWNTKGIPNATGKISNYIVIGVDITEREHAEEALRESEVRYRTLAEVSPDQIFIDGKDDTIQYVNSAALKLFKLPLDQVIGKPRSNFFPPEVAKSQEASLKKVFETGEPVRSEDIIQFGKAELWIDTNLVPIRNEAGDITSVLGIARDITERKHTEEALRESEQRYRNLFENMLEGFAYCRMLYDDHGHPTDFIYLNVNPAFNLITGTSVVIGKPVTEVFPGIREAFPELFEIYGRVVLTGKPESFDIDFKPSKKWLHISVYSPEKEHFFAVFEDITERRRAGEALRESEENFRSMFVSHTSIMLLIEPETGKIIDANLSAERFYGRTREELRALSIQDINALPPDVIGAERAKAVREGGTSFTFPHRIAGGEVRIVEVHSSPIAMRGKTILFSIIHDITDTRRMQDEILKTKNRWELTFNAVPDMIAIIDDHFRIVQVNKAMADRLGVSPEQAVGLTCYEVVHHTSVPPAFCPHQLLLRDSQDHSADIHEDNLNGDFYLTVSPIQDPSGAILGSVHVLRDVSEKKRAEKQIQESEEKFREIFNSANDAIHLHEVREDGLPGKFVDINEVACRMLQYTREELLEKSPLDLTTDYHSRPLEQIGEEIITKGYAIFETEHRRKDGSIVPVEVSTHIIVIQGRRMVLSIIRDLTRRKRDESKLRQLSADYKAIIDNAPAMIWYKDTKNNFVRVNPAAARTFGMPVDKIEGKSSYDIFPDFTEEYYRDDLEVINSGKPKLGIIETLTAATGEHLWLQTDKIPLRDDRGTIAGVLVFAVNITELKHVEEVLRETNEYLNSLFDYANAPIIVWDPQFRITRFNHSFEDLTHRFEQEVIGQRLDMLFPEESRENSLNLIKKTLEGERWEVVEIPILVKDGSVRTVLWNSANILDTKGRIISTIAQGVDITDRKALEQEMASHEEELRRFAGVMEIVNKKLKLLSSITRHDINNQLMVLMGFLELLERKQPDKSFSSYFTKITNAAERIQAMIQFTKTYEDIGVNAPVWQDTRTLIDTATKEVALGSIRLIHDIPAGLTVFADPLIVKVFYNLMDNAVRYGGKITTIRFSADELDGDYVIVCEDDGNGVAVEEKEMIFERGFGKNTGLGLFLSREILTITGITITENGEPGKGARFEMLVPKEAWR